MLCNHVIQQILIDISDTPKDKTTCSTIEVVPSHMWWSDFENCSNMAHKEINLWGDYISTPGDTRDYFSLVRQVRDPGTEGVFLIKISRRSLWERSAIPQTNLISSIISQLFRIEFHFSLNTWANCPEQRIGPSMKMLRTRCQELDALWNKSTREEFVARCLTVKYCTFKEKAPWILRGV
jgi:hypothetical protein